eukprot:TRINITY_DN4267_c0_g1_i1.p1 TRINITY_DN4267_c0_g1~~TRINITY_DN4267_c0_g1_i1.p1  ORF type:complete len:147 (+),score=25.47 TRINITY_DN4267_c0_g1_i1:60-443(+)
MCIRDSILALLQDNIDLIRTSIKQGKLHLGEMQLLVMRLSGKHLFYEVEPTTTIAEVKTMVQSTEGFELGQQSLVFAGRKLEDTETIASINYDPNQHHRLHVVFQLDHDLVAQHTIPPAGSGIDRLT